MASKSSRRAYELAVYVASSASAASHKRAREEVIKAFAATALPQSKAKISKISVSQVPASSPDAISSPKLIDVATKKTEVFGANAVCRYLAAAGPDTPLEVDQWVEWDARTRGNEALPASSPASKMPYLFGSKLTLADVVVGTTFHLQFKDGATSATTLQIWSRATLGLPRRSTTARRSGLQLLQHFQSRQRWT